MLLQNLILNFPEDATYDVDVFYKGIMPYVHKASVVVFLYEGEDVLIKSLFELEFSSLEKLNEFRHKFNAAVDEVMMAYEKAKQDAEQGNLSDEVQMAAILAQEVREYMQKPREEAKESESKEEEQQNRNQRAIKLLEKWMQEDDAVEEQEKSLKALMEDLGEEF